MILFFRICLPFSARFCVVPWANFRNNLLAYTIPFILFSVFAVACEVRIVSVNVALIPSKIPQDSTTAIANLATLNSPIHVSGKLAWK